MSSKSIRTKVLAIGLQILMVVIVAGQQNSLFSNPSQIPKTNFHCKGRPAGYYADVQAGCQIYHMCDGLGRQFSYTCPNTTLFQQRMLICDHWYMVNCSKAESDYDANLLIGQRDKPFVRDDEHDVRTPRPDLFDRPGHDIAGESFRKAISPLLNSIQSFEKRPVLHKAASSSVAVENRNEKPFVLPGRWNTIQTTSLPIITTQRSNFQSSFNQLEASASSFSGSDLKTSSSQDSRRTQNENVFENDEKPHQKSTVKPLVIEFEPPFLHPIFNATETVTTTTKAPQFNRPLPTASIPAFSQTTVNTIPNLRPLSPIDDRSQSRLNVNQASSGVSNFGDRLKTSTETPITSTPNLLPVLNDAGNKLKEPPTVLLPPYETPLLNPTQGPPVYREWQLPASDLQPPFDENKSNGAITISSDENQIPVIPPHTTQAGPAFLDKDLVPPLFESFSNIKLPSLSLQPPAYSPINDTRSSFPSNHSFPSLSAINNGNAIAHATDKSQTQRSVTPLPSAINSVSTKRNSETTTRKELNYLELKKRFSVPEFTFPLENIERPSYTENNAVNSFQIKIPDDVAQSQELISDGSSNEVQRKPWYGENAKCPECHPSFLKPGTCEPCIKIRR